MYELTTLSPLSSLPPATVVECLVCLSLQPLNSIQLESQGGLMPKFGRSFAGLKPWDFSFFGFEQKISDTEMLSF